MFCLAHFDGHAEGIMYQFSGQHGFGASRAEDRALFDDRNLIELQRHIDIMQRHDNGDVLLQLKPPEEPQELDLIPDIEVCQRFVKQQDPGALE
jgi:hypothetical protein